ncbi:hypothetical protein [Lutibacter sp.]
MKQKIIVFSIFLTVCMQAFSQQLVLETGKAITSFDYKNSQGNQLDNLQSTNQNYMYVGYRTKVFKDFIFASLGVNYSTYGAIGSDNVLNNYFEWETSYLGLNVGLDFRLFKIKKINFYVKSTFSSEFIIQGTQTLNNTVYDLVGADDFDQTNYFFKVGTFIDYPISKHMTLFFQYMGGKSKQLRSSVSNIDQEQLRLVSHNFGFGLFINLKS